MRFEQVMDNDNFKEKPAYSLAAGYSHVIAIREDGLGMLLYNFQPS